MKFILFLIIILILIFILISKEKYININKIQYYTLTLNKTNGTTK